MALPKKKVKIVKKKKPVAKQEAAATKKVVKKKAAPSAAKKATVKKKAVVKKKAATGKGKYPYEPYRAKKNMGNAAKNAILQGKDTDTVIEVVVEAFPESNISKASVGYYRNALKKEGYEY